MEVFSITQTIQFGCLLEFVEDVLDIIGNRLAFTSATFWVVLDHSHVGIVIRLCVLEELEIKHFAFILIIRGIQLADSLILLFRKVEAHSREYLPKLLCRYFEPAQLVPILEKLLGVESVDQLVLAEGVLDAIGSGQLLRSDALPPVSDTSLGLLDAQMRRNLL